jgi:mannose-6-phosphate isomerase-like protein (cupin superfamily)
MVIKVRLGKTVRPWGTFYDLEREEGYLVKKLHLRPESRTSLQYHKEREEVWVVVSGHGNAWHQSMFDTNDPICEVIGVGDTLKVKVGEPHRIENTSTSEDLVIVEVQLGKICDEEDIVRIADDYGR